MMKDNTVFEHIESTGATSKLYQYCSKEKAWLFLYYFYTLGWSRLSMWRICEH